MESLINTNVLLSSISSLLSLLSTPVVLLQADGKPSFGNCQGQQRFQQLQPSCSWLPNQTLSNTFPQWLQLPYSTWLADSLGIAKLQPFPKGALCEGQALLEWVTTEENRGEQLKIFQEVAQAINSSLMLEDIFESLADILQAHIPYQEAVMVILDDTQNGIKTLVRMYADGSLDITGENHAFAGYDAVVDQVLSNPLSQRYQGQALPDSRVFPETAAAAIVVPLINKGVVIGLIAMSTTSQTGFDQRQEELLSQVSVQLAMALENAKLYWQTRAQASREFLINQLTMAIRESLDIDVILSTAVMELGKVLGVSRCYIRYFSDESALPPPAGQQHPPESSPIQSTEEPTNAHTIPEAAHEIETRRMFAYHMPGVPPLQHIERVNSNTSEDFEHRVFQLRKGLNAYNPFILNDVRDCPAQLAAQEFFEENQIKSLAIIPILIRNTPVGTITLHQCDAYRAWVMEDVELLKAMAEHLGVALHQANLFLTLDQQKQELEKTLQELQQAQLYLIQSEKMAVLGQFVAGIAHEVNTPLGTIISNNNTLKTCFTKLKDRVSSGDNEQMLSVMDDLLSLNKMASERIQDIVKNLRNFARLDESELKTVDIHEGIESTLLVMKSSLKPNVQIIREYGDNIPHLQCYPGLLNQVFMNMLVNASHAFDDKPGDITIRTWLDEEARQVRIAFTDTGKGIAPEHMSRIFDPGFTTKGVGVGTGLGLALCYRIVEKHGGRIEVESEVGVGTTFTVSLPAQGD